MNSIYAYTLDWNPITVEAYNDKKNEITLIFNLDVTTDDKIKNVVQYIIGRIVWGFKNFPLNARIIVKFDIRGQNVIVSRSNSVKNNILELLNNLNIANQISIEFIG